MLNGIDSDLFIDLFTMAAHKQRANVMNIFSAHCLISLSIGIFPVTRRKANVGKARARLFAGNCRRRPPIASLSRLVNSHSYEQIRDMFSVLNVK